MKRHRDRWMRVNADSVDLEIRMEQERGVKKFGRYHSMHEAYAVVKEELDEFWDGVKANDPDPEELLQVCATARRALLELCEQAAKEAK